MKIVLNLKGSDERYKEVRWQKESVFIINNKLNNEDTVVGMLYTILPTHKNVLTDCWCPTRRDKCQGKYL